MSFPRHLRKKRPKPRPNSRPGRLDLTSVKLRSSALGRCQTKPKEIGRKRSVLRDLTHDGFGLPYAKRSQFRVVENGTSKGWPGRKLARRQARPTRDGAPRNAKQPRSENESALHRPPIALAEAA